jgi:hypothetical protein
MVFRVSLGEPSFFKQRMLHFANQPKGTIMELKKRETQRAVMTRVPDSLAAIIERQARERRTSTAESAHSVI